MEKKSLLVLSAAFFLFTACTAKHDSIYIYEQKETKAYTTDRAIEFDVKHYKMFGNTNVLVIDDAESLKDKKRAASVKALCSEFEMDCEKLNLSKFDAKTIVKAVDHFNKYDEDTFLLMSPSKVLTAKYIGLVNLLEHEGNDDSLRNILLGLRIEDFDRVLSEVKSLKD